jgi:hypothetical protein
MRLLQVVLLTGLLGLAAHAQSTDASVVGTIRDPSGAAVAGVTVTITNTRTNVAKNATSNEMGLYEIPNLQPSDYQGLQETGDHGHRASGEPGGAHGHHDATRRCR